MDSINRTLPQVPQAGGPAFTVVNDTPSLPASDSVSISGAGSQGESRPYKPHYQFGRALHSCGCFDGLEVAETISMADACKLRDQLHISVLGLPGATPDVYKNAKPFENLPTYTWGKVDTTSSCSPMLTINWTVSSNEVHTPSEAKAFCRKYHIPYQER